MKKLIILGAALLAAMSFTGCGLVSGTAFISQEVDGDVFIDNSAGGLRGGGNITLDATMYGDTVDLTDNSDWKDFTIEGVEDGCIYVEANNHLTTEVSGEVWIVPDLSFSPGGDPDAVRNAPGAFRIFHGLAIPGDPNAPHDPDTSIERVFHCFETIALLENTDLLVSAIQDGKFLIFGLGDQSIYCFTLTGIAFGFHVTGSL